MSARRAIARFRPPDEREAEDRAWAVVRSVHADRAPVIKRRGHRRFAAVFASALVAGVVVLSPAGATVERLVTRALGIEHASPALSSLPAPGRLLASGPGGTWTVAGDGALRRLGPWTRASWSPHGRFVVVAQGDQLTAIDAGGVLQWTLGRPSVHDPRWYSPSGFRVAYLSNRALRVVAGDGTGDRPIAANVAPVAPAWRPGHEYQLAYVSGAGRLLVRDADTGRTLWSHSLGPGTTKLEWSRDGRYLLALSPSFARLYDARGALASKLSLTHAVDGALSPDGRTLAVVLGGANGELVLDSLLAPRTAPRRALAGAGLQQVLWSPDGRWLLVSWPAADQWVFIRVAGTPRIAAVSHIAQQLGRASPQLDGWCCTAR